MDVPAGVTQEEGNTGFSIHLLSAVLALIFLARRIQPFLSLVDREVEFCVLTIQSFSTRWAFLFSFFSFSVRKIPFAGIELTGSIPRCWYTSGWMRGYSISSRTSCSTPEIPPRSLYLHETNGPETPTEAFHSLHVSVAWRMSKKTSITYHVITVHNNRNILGLNPEGIDK